jgi:hypothetical protein
VGDNLGGGVNIYECMEERLKRVIDKIIIPHYPTNITYTIKVEEDEKLVLNFSSYNPIPKTFKKYIVNYFFPDEETMNKYYLPISEETESLFDMLGPDNYESIDVIGRRPHDIW